MKVIVLTRGGLWDTLSARGVKVRHRSNPYRKVWLNPQKSAWAIVPRKPVKTGRGKGPAAIREIETAYQSV